MGGHGTWHIGSLFPDRFAAIGPSAGWISFSSYAGGPSESGRSIRLTQMLRARCWPATHWPASRISRRRGSTSCTVITMTTCRSIKPATMREQLAKFHPDFVYKEQPGAGHWWGNACCDWPALFAFFGDHVYRGANRSSGFEFVDARAARFTTLFLGHGGRTTAAGQLSRVDLQVPARHAHDLRHHRERTPLGIAVECATSSRCRVASHRSRFAVDGTTLSRHPARTEADTLWLERADAGWSVGGNRVRIDKRPQPRRTVERGVPQSLCVGLRDGGYARRERLDAGAGPLRRGNILVPRQWLGGRRR